MTRRPPGLFGFQAGDPTPDVDEVPDNPKHRPCPACGANRGEPCTRPSRDGGRQPLRAIPGDPLRRGFHPARAVIPEPEPDPEAAGTQHGDPAAQEPPQQPEPEPPEPSRSITDISRQRPTQPPSARTKADLRWAMNL